MKRGVQWHIAGRPSEMAKMQEGRAKARARKQEYRKASNDVLLEWVSAAPDTRAARLAQGINIFASKRDVEVLLEPSTDAGSVGLSPLATRLLELAPDKAAVLQGFGKHFIRPTGSVVSRKPWRLISGC